MDPHRTVAEAEPAVQLPCRVIVLAHGERDLRAAEFHECCHTGADEFGAVDINIIPSQLLERVEIVTGGASGIGAALGRGLAARGAYDPRESRFAIAVARSTIPRASGSSSVIRSSTRSWKDSIRGRMAS